MIEIQDTSPPLLTRDDEAFMRIAMREAARAAEIGEVPVGAIAVQNGKVIGRGYNQVELLKDATAHAEMIVMTQASSAKNDWRLDDVTIYVTKEPCPMCAGAMVNARVKRVVYGLCDPRSGGAGGALNITQHEGMLHRVEVTSGFLEEECKAMFQAFFKSVRQRRKNGEEKIIYAD